MQTINDLFDTSFICEDVTKIAREYKLPTDIVGVQYTKTLLHMTITEPYKNMTYDTFKATLINMTKQAIESRKTT